MPNYPPLPPRPGMFDLSSFKPEVRLPAQRKVKLDDPSGTFTGSYDPDVVRDTVTAAKQHGVDPRTALAMALQETTLGNAYNGIAAENPLHYNTGLTSEQGIDLDSVRRAGQTKSAQRLKRGFNLDSSLDKLSSSFTTHPEETEERQIQRYNGLGKLDPKKYPSMYGQPTSSLPENFYGKRVIDIRSRMSPSLEALLTAFND